MRNTSVRLRRSKFHLRYELGVYVGANECVFRDVLKFVTEVGIVSRVVLGFNATWNPDLVIEESISRYEFTYDPNFAHR